MKYKVGDRVFSKYFNAWLTIIAIEDNNNWWFRHPVNRAVTKAQTPLSYFEKMNTKLDKTVKKFVDSQDKLAKKYKVKVSISFGDNEVVLADHREDKK